MISVTDVNTILIWYTRDQNMVDLVKLLNKEGVDLEEENDATGSLSVKLTKASDE